METQIIKNNSDVLKRNEGVRNENQTYLPTGKEITRGSLTFSASSNTIKKSTNLIFKDGKSYNYGMDVYHENDKKSQIMEHEYGIPSVRYSSIATRVETTSRQHRILTPLRDKKNKKLAIPDLEKCDRILLEGITSKSKDNSHQIGNKFKLPGKN